MIAEDEPCPGCGDGDRAGKGYFHCPVCDAEWPDEDDDDDGDPRTPEFGVAT